MKKNGIVNTDVKIINLDDYTSNDNFIKTMNNLYDAYSFKHPQDKFFLWDIYDNIDSEIKSPIPIYQIREKYKKFK